MWFATPDGLNKFNGYDFTVYRHQYEDSTSIACNATRCVTVDGAGRVWIGTGEGLSLYDDEKERFSNFYLNCNGRNVAVVNIVQMRKGKLLLATTEGLVVFDMDTHRFLEDALPVSVSLLKNAAMARLGGKIYIGAAQGLYEYSDDTKKACKLASWGRDVNVQVVFCQMMDRIWVATEGGGLFVYDKTSKRLKIILMMISPGYNPTLFVLWHWIQIINYG